MVILASDGATTQPSEPLFAPGVNIGLASLISCRSNARQLGKESADVRACSLLGLVIVP
ncbi:MAG: hypothetical protein ACXWXT_09230 [Candidatus Binatia bacterium]